MTVAERNGTVERSTVPSLRTLTPERKTIEIDGTPYEAWVTTHGRYPGTLRVEIEAARQDWKREDAESEEFNVRAWHAYVLRLLLLLVPGLDYETADLLDPQAQYDLLVDLGALAKLDTAEAAESTNPPAAVADSTGSTPPPTSAPTTAPK